ncbi:terminase small subunit, partial [Morganella morganii]
GEITVRVAELQQEHRTRHNITVSDLLRELEEARKAALTAETPQSSAAVAATMGKARITGLDKVVIDLTADVKVENRSIKDIFDG